MGLYWNPWALTGTMAMAAALVLAAVIFLTNPQRMQNRALAAYLLFVALGYGIGVGLMFASSDARTALAFQAVSLCCAYSAAPLYLAFLSTLPTRALAWLKPRPVRVLLWLSPLAIIPLTALNYRRLVVGVVPVPYARFDASFTDLGSSLFLGYQLVSTLAGVVAAIGVLRSTRGRPVSRRQAKWYAATFLLYDALVLASFVLVTIAFSTDPIDVVLYRAGSAIIFPAALLLFVCMLGYSILHTQLFDIDLKIKFALGKGTLGAGFLAVFFVVSQLVQVLAGQALGAVAGAVAAGLLLFLLRPLERLAHRVADRAMPNTKDTPAYAQFRKMEVYKATAESFFVDGRLTRRERDALSRLAAKLGIAAGDARAIEADLQAA